MDTPDLKWPPQNGLWNLAKGPTILAQSDQWDLLAYGEIRTARERERDAIFPCISLLLLIISCNLYICGLLFVFRFEVKMLKIEVATLRISIEQDLYDMWSIFFEN